MNSVRSTISASDPGKVFHNLFAKSGLEMIRVNWKVGPANLLKLARKQCWCQVLTGRNEISEISSFIGKGSLQQDRFQFRISDRDLPDFPCLMGITAVNP